jgi:hypothetical protein
VTWRCPCGYVNIFDCQGKRVIPVCSGCSSIHPNMAALWDIQATIQATDMRLALTAGMEVRYDS